MTNNQSLYSPSYSSTLSKLLSQPPSLPLFTLPTSPSRPRQPALVGAIPSLDIHPTLESALHLLNLSLPSAHFLLRHMQDPARCPEAAFLHGILHRLEGDIDNARAWYRNVRDVDGEVLVRAWPGADGADESFAFLDAVEKVRKEGAGDEEALRTRSLEEIKAVIKYCEEKFGTERVEDARTVWVGMSDDHKKKAGDMLVGGEGWREF